MRLRQGWLEYLTETLRPNLMSGNVGEESFTYVRCDTAENPRRCNSSLLAEGGIHMRKLVTTVVACGSAILSNPEAFAQGLPDQKLAAEIAKLKAETEKIKLESDNAQFSVIRGATGGEAKLTAPEKTAEAVLLSRASLAGVATKVVTELNAAGFGPSEDIAPVVVWGASPPSVSQWLLFKEEHAKLRNQFTSALRGWSDANSNKMMFGSVAALATLVATVIPLFKTDSTLSGGTITPDESDSRAALSAALLRAGYGTFQSTILPKTDAEVTMLLGGLSEDYNNARKIYNDEYLLFYAGLPANNDKARKIQAAAEKLKAAIDQFETLRSRITTDTNGTTPATLIYRQKMLSENPQKHPIIYLLNVDGAFTATTKKGLFTGLGGKVPAYGTFTTVVDYAIAAPSVERRGTALCTIKNMPMKDVLDIDAKRMASAETNLCADAAASTARK